MAMCVPDQQFHHGHQQQQKKTVIKGKKLFLESYLSFLRSHDHQSLSCDQLKQIISIHGFKQLKCRKALDEAVVMIKPIDPARSTLNDNISSQAFMKLDEAIKDLAALNWQECSVTSIRSINSLNYSDPIPVPPSTGTKPSTRKEKQTLTPTTTLGSGSGPSTSKSLSNEAGSTFSMTAEENRQLFVNKKRKRKNSLHDLQ